MDIKLWMSPMTHTVFVGRIGKGGDTLEKYDVTDDAINAITRIIEDCGPIELKLKKDGRLVKRLVLEDVDDVVSP